MSLMSADTTGAGGGYGGMGGERAPRLTSMAGDYAAWKKRMEGYFMRVSLERAYNKERPTFGALCADVLRWETEEEDAVVALAAALRIVPAGSAHSSASSPAAPAGSNPAAPAASAAASAAAVADQATRRAIRSIVDRSRRAYAILYECIPSELQQQSAHVQQGYAYGLWHWLETKLQPTESDSVHALLGQFFALAQEVDESFDAYRARVNKVDALLTAAKACPPRMQYAFMLLDRLQPRYAQAVLALRLSGTR